MRQRVRVILDVEVDPEDVIATGRAKSPAWWDWTEFSDLSGVDGVVVKGMTSLLACCQSQLDAGSTALTGAEHDDGCVNRDVAPPR